MNRKSVLITALAAGVFSLAAKAQVSPAPPAPSTAAPAQPAPVPPTAFPAKIALISFEQAVLATNEGQRAALDVQKKFEPQKTKLAALGTEIESLKKQADALPATTPAEERASRLKTIDTKEKQYQRDFDDANTSYNSDIQEAMQKISQKVYVVLQAYVKTNGYTLLIDAGNQGSSIMWASQDPNADITEAVITAYNASSGIAPPPAATPAAPSASRPSSTTPKPAAPRPATPAKPQ